MQFLVSIYNYYLNKDPDYNKYKSFPISFTFIYILEHPGYKEENEENGDEPEEEDEDRL
jgi:hypothetical protein